MDFSYYIFTGGLWCKVVDMGYVEMDYGPFVAKHHAGWVAYTNTGRTHFDSDCVDDLIAKVLSHQDKAA